MSDQHRWSPPPPPPPLAGRPTLSASSNLFGGGGRRDLPSIPALSSHHYSPAGSSPFVPTSRPSSAFPAMVSPLGPPHTRAPVRRELSPPPAFGRVFPPPADDKRSVSVPPPPAYSAPAGLPLPAGNQHTPHSSGPGALRARSNSPRLGTARDATPAATGLYGTHAASPSRYGSADPTGIVRHAASPAFGDSLRNGVPYYGYAAAAADAEPVPRDGPAVKAEPEPGKAPAPPLATVPAAAPPPPQQQQPEPEAPPLIERRELVVSNDKVLDMVKEWPSEFLGEVLYAPEMRMPHHEGHENATFRVRINEAWLRPSPVSTSVSPVVRRALWGTDVYTDDSDPLAILFHQDMKGGKAGRGEEDGERAGEGADGDARRPSAKTAVKPAAHHHSSTGKERRSVARVQKMTQSYKRAQEQLLQHHNYDGGDAVLTFRVLPRLVKYTGSLRYGLMSRTFDGVHDGRSIYLESAVFEPNSRVKRQRREHGHSSMKRRLSQRLQQASAI